MGWSCSCATRGMAEEERVSGSSRWALSSLSPIRHGLLSGIPLNIAAS